MTSAIALMRIEVELVELVELVAIVLAELVAGGDPVPELLDRFMRRRFERARLIVENSLQLSHWETSPGTCQAL